MDEERLVIEVQNHSIIYDFSHPFYKDNEKKDMAWNEISETIGVDVELCKTKWRTLRDNFVKQRRKVSSSGPARGPEKEWKFKNIMSFLVPFLQSRSSKSNLGGVAGQELSVPSLKKCGSDEQASCSSEFRLPSRPPSISSAPSPSQPTTAAETDRPHRSRSPRERVSRRQTPAETAGASDVEERLLSILKELPPTPQTVLDECHHFALSLVPLLNMMDYDRRQETKIGILQYIANQQRRQATGPQPQYPRHRPSTFPTSTISPRMRNSCLISIRYFLQLLRDGSLPNTGL